MIKHTLIPGIILFGSISCSYGNFQSPETREAIKQEIEQEQRKLNADYREWEQRWEEFCLETEKGKQELLMWGKDRIASQVDDQEFSAWIVRMQQQRTSQEEDRDCEQMIQMLDQRDPSEVTQFRDKILDPKCKQEFSELIKKLQRAKQKDLDLRRESWKFGRKQLELDQRWLELNPEQLDLEQLNLEQEKLDKEREQLNLEQEQLNWEQAQLNWEQAQLKKQLNLDL